MEDVRVAPRPDPDIGRGDPAQPLPPYDDYSDIVSDDDLRRVRDAVAFDEADAEFEVIDGPAW